MDAIKARGQYYQLPTLDLYRTLDWNEDNHDEFFIDHVHPNEEGYELIGHVLSQFLIETYNERLLN